MSSILRNIDLFSKPASDGKLQKTTYSGVFTLLTYAIITAATLGKLGTMFADDESPTKEEFMKDKRLLESKYSNDTNFQWLESSNYQDTNNTIMNLTEVGIKKVEIHFAQEGAFELAEKQERISEETGVKIDLFNKTKLDFKMSDYGDSGMFRHVKYEVKVRSNDNATNNQTFAFTSKDMKFDQFHNPMLDITNYILSKGDHFSLDQNVVNKTQTTFRVYADREAIAIESMRKTIEFYEEQKMIAEGYGGSFSEADCTKYNLGTEELSLSDAEEAEMEAFIKYDRAKKMAAFNDQYNSYNLAYLRAKEKYVKELDDYYVQYRYDKHHKRVYGDDEIDANSEISEDQIETFKKYMYKCYTIKYNNAAYTDLSDANEVIDNSWLGKFHAFEIKAIDEIDEGFKGNRFADSVQIKIQTENQPMRLVSQTSDFLNNWKCFYMANHHSYGAEDGICEKNRNILYFQKIENQMQEIYSAPRKLLKVYKPVDLDSSIEYKRVIQTSNYQPYSRTKIDFEPDNDFETVYSASFSVESTKVVDKQIWLIQDQDAFDNSEYMAKINAKFGSKSNSTSGAKRLLAEADDKLTAQKSGNGLMMVLDLFSFIGSIWFVLTHLIFGPLSSFMLKDQKPRDIIHVATGSSPSQQELELQQQQSS